jgi:hypothetical protein
VESRHPHHGAVQAFIKCSRAGRVILDLLRKLKLSLWELCKNINVATATSLRGRRHRRTYELSRRGARFICSPCGKDPKFMKGSQYE